MHEVSALGTLSAGLTISLLLNHHTIITPAAAAAASQFNLSSENQSCGLTALNMQLIPVPTNIPGSSQGQLLSPGNTLTTAFPTNSFLTLSCVLGPTISLIVDHLLPGLLLADRYLSEGQ